MARSSDKKKQARKLYCQGMTLAAIAERIGVTYRTISAWKKEAFDSGDDWKKIRADVKGIDPAPKPKLVSFERPRGEKAKPSPAAAVASEYGDLGTMEGQLRLIDEAIAIAMKEAKRPDSPQTYASSLSSVPKLLAERRAIRPMDKRELVLELAKMYRNPAELFQDLMTLGFGENAA